MASKPTATGGMTARILAILLCGLLFRPVFAARADDSLRVGAAAVNLVADDSMVISGGIGPGYAKGQEGELRAAAVVLEKSPWGKVALVACDVLFVPGALAREALGEIETRTGIASDRVLINATHTHHAPSTTKVHGYDPDPKFLRSLRDGIVAAVRQADGAMTDQARFFYRLGEEKTVGANSRQLLSDNTIWWIGDLSDQVRPTGPFDPQLPVLAFRAPSGKSLAVVFNHSTHTIGTRSGAVRSPSFYGLAAQELERQLGGATMFLEGASGSTHNITGVPVVEAVERMKGAVNAALAQASERKVERLAAIKRPFRFQVRSFDEQVEDEKVVGYCRRRAPTHADFIIDTFRNMRKELKSQQGAERESVIQVVLIGDVAVVGVPAEFFTLLGVEIKRRSPFRDTFVAELANDWIGYFPDREAHSLGGYQTWMGFHSYAEVGAGERMVDEVVALLEELARGAKP